MYGFYNCDGKDYLKENYLLLNSLNKFNKFNIDEIPEQYIKKDYIVEKIYDKNKNVGY